jgi:secernin
LCDILIALPNSTRDKVVIFGKNSDREPNEAQVIEIIPHMKHEEEYVRLTNMVYPQARETYAILISRPWWIYGAEMGVNEYGVIIGNVAVFTREPYSMSGMLGMDMLRLALERNRSAREALRFMIKLLEEVGQGGNYSYEKKFRYHNSFIIADPSEAWVLETAGKYWVAKRVRDIYSISNALTINDDWDLAHDDVVRHGVEKHGCGRDNFSFAKCYSDKIYTRLAHGRERREYTFKRLSGKKGDLTVWDFIDILRSHSIKPYHPAKGSMRDICMHYGGLLRPSQTASSMIAILKGDKQLNLLTLSSNPCLSLYKPLTLEVKIPFNFKNTTNKYNPNNYWWRHEILHRKIQLCWKEYSKEYINTIQKYEKQYLPLIISLFNNHSLTIDKINKILEEIKSFEEELFEKWMKKLENTKCKPPLLYKLRIKSINKKAKYYE